LTDCSAFRIIDRVPKFFRVVCYMHRALHWLHNISELSVAHGRIDLALPACLAPNYLIELCRPIISTPP